MAHLTGFGSRLKMTICHVSGWHRYAILSGESIKGWQFVAAPLASDFCKSDHLQVSISHSWPFNVIKCLQRNSHDNGLNIRKKKTLRLTNWPNIATKFAKRGTLRSLLLSNWSSWHHAASATHWTEFESNTQSSTSPGESCARLPAGPRPHRRWSSTESTWSAERGLWGYTGAVGRWHIKKRYVYAIQAPIPQKPRLCGGPISLLSFRWRRMQNIFQTSKNLSMISITKVVISNEILNLLNEHGFRAKYSRNITTDFLGGKGQLSLHPTCPLKNAKISPMHPLIYKIVVHQHWKKYLILFIFIRFFLKKHVLYMFLFISLYLLKNAWHPGF